MFRVVGHSPKRIDVRSLDASYFDHGSKRTDGPIIRNLGYSSLVFECPDDEFEDPMESIVVTGEAVHIGSTIDDADVEAINDTQASVEDNEEIMTQVAMLSDVLSDLNIRIDDPDFIAVARRFQESNEP